MTTVTATTVTAPDTGSRLSARRSLLILLVLCGAPPAAPAPAVHPHADAA